MLDAITTRRWYTVWVSPTDVVNLLGNWRRCEFVSLPVLDECRDEDGKRVVIPNDAELIDCVYDWHRRAIGVRISQLSFPETADGMCPPSLVATHHTIHVLRPRQESSDGPLIVEMPADD